MIVLRAYLVVAGRLGCCSDVLSIWPWVKSVGKTLTQSLPSSSGKSVAGMQFKDKIETYLLLCLERSILELRQQNWMSRETSRCILEWIDGRLTRRRGSTS